MRQNILITGASSGLGRGMAIEFAKLGRNLALCARRTERLNDLKQELLTINPDINVIIKPLDINDHDAVFDTFEAFANDMNGIDRIIVNAGMGKGASLGTGYFEANKQTALTNFVSAIAQCEAALKIFRRQYSGHLVTISSVSAARGFGKSFTVYAATKAGLSSLSEGIYMDLKRSPIQLTVLHPGFIHTEINESIPNKPFVVDAETGCKAMVKAIEKEVKNAYIPGWPWTLIWYLMKIMPVSLLAKMS